MSEFTGPTLLDQANEAAVGGDWPAACDRLLELDASSPLRGADLAKLADAAYAAGRLDVTLRTWERAYAEGMESGDLGTAADAAVRVAMHLLFDTALMAPVRTWIARAERLLGRDGETAADAWLAVVRNYERMLSGDFAAARQWALRAIELGTRCDPAAAAVGRIAEARSLILSGQVPRGLALLNEAAASAGSGELDPVWRGVVYCEVVCALQALAQFDLAQEWTTVMEEWHRGQPVGSIHGRCRVHRAEILRLRGSCAEAEMEALLACEELRPWLRREFGWPLTELGRIRLRRGNVDGAEEAFLAAHEAGWDPEPGLALVHLARGNTALAASSIKDALENPSSVPSKELPPNTELRRAPLLEAQVEIALAAGDLRRARSAAEELAQIAGRFGSGALRAAAGLSSGRVRLAEGDAAGSRGDFELALHLWADIGAPYEAAVARVGLANAFLAAGNVERARLELQAARSAIERIGALQPADSVRERGTPEHPAPGPGSTTAENIFRREGDYWQLTFGGETVRLRDLKGLHHLARLLAAPARELHAIDLATGAGSAAHDMTAPPLLDAPARESYRRRLEEIEEDLEQASMLGDGERAAQAEAERDLLARELARAVGLGGRERRAGSASERARASVTRAVRQAMARIRAHHPALGEHLERAIRTGTYCVYLPDSRVPGAWKV